MLVAQTQPDVCRFTTVLMGGPWGPDPVACATHQDRLLFNFGSAIYVVCTCPEDERFGGCAFAGPAGILAYQEGGVVN